MDIETMGLGAGSYPEPPEEKTKRIDVEINLQYKIKEVEIPEDWDREKIEEDIKENMDYYIDRAISEEMEVDING